MKDFMINSASAIQHRIDRAYEWLMEHLPAEVTARNTLLFCVACLVCIGTVMVASASMPYAERLHEDPMHYVSRHALYLFISFFAAVAAYRIQLKYWFGQAPVVLWIATVLMLISVLLIGRDVNGSTRWLSIAGFTFQPSEVAKFTMAVFTADYVVRRASEVRENLWTIGRLAIPVGSTVTMILLEPDLGASAVIVMTVALIFFIAGANVRALVGVAIAIAVFLIGFIAIEPYRVRRIFSYGNPWDDPLGDGYQLSQSLMAFGRGEWFGTGLGHSIQKLAYLPEAHTDFMLAVTAEELGFVGIAVLFTISFLMVACCMRIAHRALSNQHLRSGYLAYGIACIFLLQICVNAGMNMGLIPTKGLTLPFISYGGSSLLMCAFMMGVIFKIDRDTSNQAEQQLT